VNEIDPRQRVWWRPCQQLGGIACEQPDVADGMRFDLRQNLGHAVDVGLAAMKPGLGGASAIRCSPPEGFESDIVDRRIEQSRGGRAGAGDVGRRRGSKCSIRSAWCDRARHAASKNGPRV
jgi:hypothetical protein